MDEVCLEVLDVILDYVGAGYELCFARTCRDAFEYVHDNVGDTYVRSKDALNTIATLQLQQRFLQLTLTDMTSQKLLICYRLCRGVLPDRCTS